MEFGTLSVRVCLYVCVLMLETPKETKAVATAGPQRPGNAGPAKGKVTCLSVRLSVSADLFQTAGVDFHRACCVHCMLSEGIMPQTTSQKC